MSRRTPGPWVFECGDHTHRYVLIKGKDDATVFYKYSAGSSKDADLDEANGRLAAAAPEMLDALKELYRKTVIGTDYERHAALNAAWTLIVKFEEE